MEIVHRLVSREGILEEMSFELKLITTRKSHSEQDRGAEHTKGHELRMSSGCPRNKQEASAASE